MLLSIDCRFIGHSGIGTYIENIVENLLSNHPEHSYLLIVDDSNKIKPQSNVNFLKTDIKPFSIKELFAFPVDEINKCDAFFSPYINIPGRIKIPVFSTIHDVVFLDVDGLSSKIGKFVRKKYYKRTVNLSSKIFTVSDFSKQRILHHFPTEKVIVVTYNGVPQSILNTKKVSSAKSDYFIFVGNIKRHKGLHTLVEAFGNAKANGLTSKLLIVGKNENFRTSDSQLSNLMGKNTDIEFTGHVSNDVLIELISNAKALIQPSVYEGFGIPPMEALCLGTNVILSDIPVFKEIYGDYPVTFFPVDNSYDLSHAITNFQTTEIGPDVKARLFEKFSYQRVADVILKNIENAL